MVKHRSKSKVLPLIAALLILGMCGRACGNGGTSGDKADVASNQQAAAGKAEGSLAQSEKVHRFIEYYNSRAGTPFVEEGECAAQDKDSGHYRTVYRLLPYEGAVVVYGKIGDVDAEFCSRGYRLYAYAPVTEKERLCATVVPDAMRAYSDTVSDEEIAEYIRRFLDPGEVSPTHMPTSDLNGYLETIKGQAELFIEHDGASDDWAWRDYAREAG